MERYKIVLVGDSNTGKTQFLRQLVDPDHSYIPLATIGCDVELLTLSTNFGNISLVIFDCSGDPRYGEIKKMHFFNSNIALIFCKAQSESCLENANKWIQEYKSVFPSGKYLVVATYKEGVGSDILLGDNTILTCCLTREGNSLRVILTGLRLIMGESKLRLVSDNGREESDYGFFLIDSGDEM